MATLTTVVSLVGALTFIGFVSDAQGLTAVTAPTSPTHSFRSDGQANVVLVGNASVTVPYVVSGVRPVLALGTQGGNYSEEVTYLSSHEQPTAWGMTPAQTGFYGLQFHRVGNGALGSLPHRFAGIDSSVVDLGAFKEHKKRTISFSLKANSSTKGFVFAILHHWTNSTSTSQEIELPLLDALESVLDGTSTEADLVASGYLDTGYSVFTAVYLDGASNPAVPTLTMITLNSNASSSPIDKSTWTNAEIFDGQWHLVVLTLKPSGGDFHVQLYVDGATHSSDRNFRKCRTTNLFDSYQEPAASYGVVSPATEDVVSGGVLVVGYLRAASLFNLQLHGSVLGQTKIINSLGTAGMRDSISISLIAGIIMGACLLAFGLWVLGDFLLQLNEEVKGNGKAVRAEKKARELSKLEEERAAEERDEDWARDEIIEVEDDEYDTLFDTIMDALVVEEMRDADRHALRFYPTQDAARAALRVEEEQEREKMAMDLARKEKWEATSWEKQPRLNNPRLFSCSVSSAGLPNSQRSSQLRKLQLLDDFPLDKGQRKRSAEWTSEYLRSTSYNPEQSVLESLLLSGNATPLLHAGARHPGVKKVLIAALVKTATASDRDEAVTGTGYADALFNAMSSSNLPSSYFDFVDPCGLEPTEAQWTRLLEQAAVMKDTPFFDVHMKKRGWDGVPEETAGAALEITARKDAVMRKEDYLDSDPDVPIVFRSVLTREDSHLYQGRPFMDFSTTSSNGGGMTDSSGRNLVDDFSAKDVTTKAEIAEWVVARFGGANEAAAAKCTVEDSCLQQGVLKSAQLQRVVLSALIESVVTTNPASIIVKGEARRKLSQQRQNRLEMAFVKNFHEYVVTAFKVSMTSSTELADRVTLTISGTGEWHIQLGIKALSRTTAESSSSMILEPSGPETTTCLEAIEGLSGQLSLQRRSEILRWGTHQKEKESRKRLAAKKLRDGETPDVTTDEDALVELMIRGSEGAAVSSSLSTWRFPAEMAVVAEYYSLLDRNREDGDADSPLAVQPLNPFTVLEYSDDEVNPMLKLACKRGDGDAVSTLLDAALLTGGAPTPDSRAHHSVCLILNQVLSVEMDFALTKLVLTKIKQHQVKPVAVGGKSHTLLGECLQRLITERSDEDANIERMEMLLSSSFGYRLVETTALYGSHYQNGKGYNLLHYVAECGSSRCSDACIPLLFRFGAKKLLEDPNCMEEMVRPSTPLLIATVFGSSYEHATQLVENGADVESTYGEDGSTPLYLAVSKTVDESCFGQPEDPKYHNYITGATQIAFLKLILDRGAKIDRVIKYPESEDEPDEYHHPILQIAIERHQRKQTGASDVVALLLETAKKQNAERSFFDTPLRPYSDKPAVFTPLQYYATCGDAAMVKLLVECGAEIDADVTEVAPE